MAADTVKSLSITAYDAAPQNATTSTSLVEGLGAPGRRIDHSDYVVVTAGGLASTSSTYKAVRLATTSVVKSITLYTSAGMDSSTGLKLNVGTYYSDSTIDGTPASLQGTLISATTFMSATAFAQSGAGSRIAGMTNINANLINSPLWAQCGLSTDPGGYIDVVLAVQTVASGTATGGNIAVIVETVN